jgi:predicted TIM-barrel fold metal-dependent hydrolase
MNQRVAKDIREMNVAQVGSGNGPAVIDVHTFLGRWVGVDAASNLIGLRRTMAKSQIGRSVVITTNRDRNEYVKRIVDHNPSLLFGLWFRPDDTHSFLLRKAHQHIALVKVHPSHLKVRLDDPSMVPMLKFCEKERIPVLVHCGRWHKMSGYSIALDVAASYDCDFLLAHMGGVTRHLRSQTIKTIADRGIDNAFLVTSGPISRSPGKDLLDAPETCPPDIIEEAVHVLGAEKVIFGSDYPFGLPDQILKSIRMARLTQLEFEAILSQNALKVLNVA